MKFIYLLTLLSSVAYAYPDSDLLKFYPAQVLRNEIA